MAAIQGFSQMKEHSQALREKGYCHQKKKKPCKTLGFLQISFLFFFSPFYFLFFSLDVNKG